MPRRGYTVAGSLLLLILAASLALPGCTDDSTAVGSPGATGPPGPPGSPGPPPPEPGSDPGTAFEACGSCHGRDSVVPVGNVNDLRDAHHVDLHPDGPLTESGYRRLEVRLMAVDVSGSRVVIDFDVLDESGGSVTNLFAADGRFTIARLQERDGSERHTTWEGLITHFEDPGGVGDGPGTPASQATAERFTAAGGTFQHVGGASYRYSSAFDPTSASIGAGDTLRVAVQISAGDLPAGNGWCDFDASLARASGCTGATRLTRDIVRTTTCNQCHGSTPETRLAVHGGGRTEVEYCVTCHDPSTTDANSGDPLDMKVMVHKIHHGASLSRGYKIWGFGDALRDYSHVKFTKDIDDCTVCHGGGGSDAGNWSEVPSRTACGSCHDDVDFATGQGHGAGGVQPSDQSCTSCHPARGPWPDASDRVLKDERDHHDPNTPMTRASCGSCHEHDKVDFATGAGHGFGGIQQSDDDCTVCHPQPGLLVRPAGLPLPVETVHRATARAVEAARYGGGNGATIEAVSVDALEDKLTVDYSVSRDGAPMSLEFDPEWNAGPASRLALVVGWDTVNYNNLGSGQTPAQPLSIDALDVGGAVSDEGGGVYRAVVALPAQVSGTGIVALEGHPAADIDGDGVYTDRIAIRNVFELFPADTRAEVVPRREVVDVARCNHCHDAAGQGISLHGNSRTGEVNVCVVCHNGDATDLVRRPADPNDAADGKREESIDARRLIHQIHSGEALEDGLVVWGFGFPDTEHDFSRVRFIGNRRNCETCHWPGTYGVEQAESAAASTLDTGADVATPGDDLNVSPAAAVCSSCHDGEAVRLHMLQQGASFRALDADIR